MAIYDKIVDDYSAAKANPFKAFVEEPTFLSMLGPLEGLRVLDLACGSGHFSRKFCELGAAQVLGVDISSEMIAEAERLGDPSASGTQPLGEGLSYIAADASGYRPDKGQLFDLVTAQYLFPYASTTEELTNMCTAAFTALTPGGQFKSVSTGIDDTRPPKIASESMAYAMSWEGEGEGVSLHDGICVQLTLLAAGTEGVTFPNYLWSRETIAQTLTKVGFESVQWCEEVVAAGEGEEWARRVRDDFGLCHFLVATKPN